MQWLRPVMVGAALACLGAAAAGGQEADPAEPEVREPGEGTEPVALFDPDEGYDTPPDYGQDLGSAPSGEPALWGQESPDFGEELDPRWVDAPDDGFDFVAARKLLATQMATPAAVASPEDALDLVESGLLDGELGEVKERGANETGLDLRSVERLTWDCRNEVSRREVTLFGNGTVRLRSGPRRELTMRLDELNRDELVGYLSRLVRIQRSRDLRHGVAGAEDFGQIDGELGEACSIRLRLPDMPPVALRVPRLEVPQLGLAQLVEVAEELATFTQPLQRPENVSVHYKPRPGDHLKRSDGHLYRVVSITTGGDGVELEGLQEPLVIFYRIADLPALFEQVEAVSYAEPIEVSEPEVREIVDLGGRP